MPLSNSSPAKWEYKEHTRVKHDLLKKYLIPWVYHLGKLGKICYFDGFAGRGVYTDGSLGSPLIVMQLASDLDKHYGKFVCAFIEKDLNNFENLKEIVNEERKSSPEKYEKTKVIFVHDEFANVATEIIDKVGDGLAPSFFFIDPFGFSGVPFSIIKDILSIARTEVFITFMSRDINRFLDSPSHKSALDELFGTKKWRDISSRFSGTQKQQALLELYRYQLHKEANAQYTWPYKVNMDEIRQTIYYLIHATNHFKGFKIMKEIMHNYGMEGKFSYLGPDEGQMNLSDFEKPIPPLKKFLLIRFADHKITFVNLLEESYAEIPFIEKHYREALKELEKEEKLSVKRVTSKTSRGLSGEDQITFGSV